jgi:benzoylformate decarboxylase
VFLALPLDVQMALAEGLNLTPPQPPNPLVRPPLDALRQAAALLAAAQNPAVLVGNRVCEAGAVPEAVAVAEALGAPVFHETPVTHGRSGFPSDHPLAAGALPFWSPPIHARLAEFDALLAIGVKLLQLYIYHEPARAIPTHLRIVQIDDDPWELGKNYPLAVGLIGHPKPATAELAELLAATMTPQQARAAKQRAAARARLLAAERDALRCEAEAQLAARPMTPLALMEGLARVLPPDAAVIEECPTTTQGYFERVGALKNTDGYFAQRGWALGWGLNCAIGVKLAWPDRPVLALLGDGSAMYGIQGLWTAAHYRIPVVFIVANNREYRILKDCAQVLRLPAAVEGRYCELDVVSPTIDYVGLARSLGVAACRVTGSEELGAAVRRAWDAGVPQLIEAPIRRSDA